MKGRTIAVFCAMLLASTTLIIKMKRRAGEMEKIRAGFDSGLGHFQCGEKGLCVFKFNPDMGYIAEVATIKYGDAPELVEIRYQPTEFRRWMKQTTWTVFRPKGTVTAPPLPEPPSGGKWEIITMEAEQAKEDLGKALKKFRAASPDCYRLFFPSK